MNQINQDTINLIRQFEGCSLVVYLDEAGFRTVGVGHKLTPEDLPLSVGESITQAQADNYLKQDLSSACLDVENAIFVPLSDNKFGALVSLTYNCGDGPLNGTLGKLLNENNIEGAAEQFILWDKIHINGVLTVSQGLLNRRLAEQKLFLTDDNT